MTTTCPQCQGPHTLDDCPRWRERSVLEIAAQAVVDAIRIDRDCVRGYHIEALERALASTEARESAQADAPGVVMQVYRPGSCWQDVGRNEYIGTREQNRRTLYTHPAPSQSADHMRDAAPLSRIDKECLRIGQEIQRAAGELPDGWSIEIEIERGYGGAELYNDEGEKIKDFDAGDSDGLSYALTKCIEFATSSAAKGNAKLANSDEAPDQQHDALAGPEIDVKGTAP